jgi:hypothetical protein
MMFSNRILMAFDQKSNSAQRSLDLGDLWCFVLLFVSPLSLMVYIDFADAQVTSGYLKFLVGFEDG